MSAKIVGGWLVSVIRDLLVGIFSSVLYDLLLATGVGLLLGTLKAKRAQWAGPVIYGLGGFALVLVIGVALTGNAPIAAAQVQTTPSNIEDNLKIWTDHLALSLQRKKVPEDDFFLYSVTSGNEPIDVFRDKEKPGYLQFRSTLNFSPEHQAALAKLSEHDFSQFVNQLNLEVARLKLGADVGLIFDQKTKQPVRATIIFFKGVPIVNLNEFLFSSSCDDMTDAVGQIRAFVNLGLATDETKEIRSAH